VADARKWFSDAAGGLICAVVCVPYAASYAALMFTGALGGYLGAGVSVVLLTAVIGAAIGGRLSSFPFGVTNPDANVTAVLAVVLAAVAEGAAARGGPGAVLPTVLATAGMAALLTGLSLLALGSFRAGRWVRFIPYPVMGGYLAATGWLIASGSLKVASGHPLTLDSLREMVAHGPDPRFLVTVAFGVSFLVAQRKISWPLLTPVLLVAASALTFAGLAAAGLDTARAREAGWLFADLGAPQWFPPWQTLLAGAVRWEAIAAEAGGLAALVAVAAITNLLTAAGLEVATDRDADLDRELRSSGLTNLVTAAAGGYVAILSVSRTLVAFRSGARSRLTGVIVAFVCAGAALGGSQLLAYFPRVALAALLFALGTGLLYDWVVVGLRRFHRKDYAVVVLILATTVAFGFAVGVGTGVLAACVAFAVDYARAHAVKRELTGREVRSAFERPAEDQRVLDEHGARVLVIQFQGFLFFGSGYAILDRLRERFSKEPKLTCVLLDFKAVQGLDVSAAMTFQKIRQAAARNGCLLAFCGLQPQVAGVLDEAGPDAVTERFADLDHGLEWCEDRLLEAHRGEPNADAGALDRYLLAELGDSSAVDRVRGAMERREFGAGEWLFREGDPPDALYLVASGRVSVVLERAGADPLRLHTYLGGTVVGEMGLYTSEPRSASVIADEPAVLWRLSAEAFAELRRSDGELAGALHSMIVRVLAHRLAAANAEKAALRRLGAAEGA